MTALAPANRINLRRWTISAALVLLLHGVVAVGVMAWRKTTLPAEPPGPVTIDLVPIPTPVTPQQAALPPAPEQAPSAVSPSKPPEEKVEGTTKEQSAARGEDNAEPKSTEQAPSASAPITPAPPAPSENTAVEDMPDTQPGTGGGALGGPIDTRIGMPPRAQEKKPAKPNDWRKSIVGHRSKGFAARSQARRPDGAGGAPARNAIGAVIQDHAADRAAATAGGRPVATEAPRNAIGAAPTNSLGSGTTGAVPTTTNAIGVTVPVRNGAGTTNSAQQSISQIASGGLSSSGAPSNATGVNGTGIGRPGAGVLGGAAKNTGAGLNGTGFHSRP